MKPCTRDINGVIKHYPLEMERTFHKKHTTLAEKQGVSLKEYIFRAMDEKYERDSK